jgi:hypothetical protein
MGPDQADFPKAGITPRRNVVVLILVGRRCGYHSFLGYKSGTLSPHFEHYSRLIINSQNDAQDSVQLMILSLRLSEVRSSAFSKMHPIYFTNCPVTIQTGMLTLVLIP